MTDSAARPGATSGPRPYPLAKLDRLIERFQRTFPAFSDQGYQNEERFFKDHFAQRMRELLSRETLGNLIEAGDFESAKTAIKQALSGVVVTPAGFRQQNNLLNQWDSLPIINAPPEELARRLNDLLYGAGPFDTRFEAWVDLLGTKKPGVWPPATYFLMLHDPAEHLMVKPSQWQLFFKEVGLHMAWPTRPSAGSYTWLRGIAHQLLADLAPLGARDLLDVQSFLWRLSYQSTDAWLLTADPTAYDLTSALNELDEIRWRIPSNQDEIQAGQTVYLWEGGDDPGVVAVARVLSEPRELETTEIDTRFHRGPGPLAPRDTRALLQIEQVLLERIDRSALSTHPRLRKLAVLAQPGAPLYRLSSEEADAFTALVAPEDDDEDHVELAGGEEAFDNLGQWQQSIMTNVPLVRELVTAYPAWIAERFGGWVYFRGLQNQRFSLHVDGRRIMRGRMNQSDGVYIWLQEPPDSLIEWLRSNLSRPAELRPRDRKGARGWRFMVVSESDYVALQDATAKMATYASTRDTTPPPNPLPGLAFVVIHGADRGEQRLGEAYVYTNYAGGSHRQLTTAVRAWRDSGGPPVYLIIYRPAPDYAFVGWSEVTAAREEAGAQPNEERYILTYAWHPFPFPVSARTMTTRLSWLSKGLAAAFRGISIRPVPAEDVRAITERAYPTSTMSQADAAFLVLSRAGGGPLYVGEILSRIQGDSLAEIGGQNAQVTLTNVLRRDNRFHNLGQNTWLLAPEGDEMINDLDESEALPVTRQPAIYADEDARFWRIHFPRELWQTARRTGTIAIGWPIDSQNQSVKRFRQIRPGDRVIAYVQGGVVGGVGVVSQAFEPENPRAGLPNETLGDEFNLYIRVAWADAPAEPVDLLNALRHRYYTALYNRIKNPHTVIPLNRDDYTALLSLLQVDDAGVPRAESRLPNVWPQLASYSNLARALGEKALNAGALRELARTIDPAPAEPLDADDLVAELLQLRLIMPVDTEQYRARPYVAGDTTALLRLAALALLVVAEGTADQYILPSRAIIDRLRSAAEAQPVERFAVPELSEADSVTLAGWYAEAGLVKLEGDTWQPVEGALDEIPGDDEASQHSTLLVRTLLAESDGTLQTDLAHVEPEAPLPLVTDLDERLRELGQDLLFDSAIVRRVYRSLLAGRHVVLSGPPGTGKTELARLLPSLLWSESPQTFNRLTLSPELPPVDQAPEQRHGYASIVVTATEDWGVRDVVGGIGPRLDGSGLRFAIEHGALTRVVLQHYEGSANGRELPLSTSLIRRDYRNEERRRYRGAWLVIDEFTRAPIDAAFGSLLTTLSGSERARIAVPSASGEPREIPLPRDFRIIGTLNSFDRHFLNQISEAMKRRFDFIDVLPPPPEYGDFEQGIAAMQALRRLLRDGRSQITRDGNPATYRWPRTLTVEPTQDDHGLQRYRWRAEQGAVEAAMTSFWRLFSAIRVFRQLGTAQIVAVYTNLLTGALVGMPWDEALDTALADSLADQLQVLNRDEQQIVEAFVDHAGTPDLFFRALKGILGRASAGRRPALRSALREADQLRNVARQSDIATDDTPLSDAQIARVFSLGAPLSLSPVSVFRRRLRDLAGERGL